MSTTNTKGLNNISQVKYSSKKEELVAFVANSPYIEKEDQPEVCKRFGFKYAPSIFRIEYRKRVKQFLRNRVTTAATVSKYTHIPHKYITQIKSKLEKANELVVVRLDRCETTKTSNVQYLSTDPSTVELINSQRS